MFTISSFFFYLGDRYGKKSRWILDVVGILIPLLMATFRTETVGNDVLGYVKPMYLCAYNASNFIGYETALLSQLSTRDLEFGFSLIGYIGTKLTGSLCGVFFLYELVMLVFIYLSIRKYNDEISKKYNLPQIKIYIAMFCYLTLFYNMSLSMMRQSMACSLIVYCIVCLIAEQYIRSAISLMGAILMHSTAAVGFVLILLYICIDRKWKNIRKLIIPAGLVIAAFGGQMYWIIMDFLSRFIPIPARYLAFEYMWNQGKGVNLAFLYLIGCAFFSVWLLKFRKDKKNNYYIFLEYIIWCSVFLTPMSIAAANVSRVLYYFFYFFVLLIPMTANRGIRIKMKHKSFIPLLICTVFWVGCVLLNDYTGTLSYKTIW